MIFNKPENIPKNEDPLLIAFEADVDRADEFISGWYDLNEEDFYSYDGDLIEFEHVVGWVLKPVIEFNE